AHPEARGDARRAGQRALDVHHRAVRARRREARRRRARSGARDGLRRPEAGAPGSDLDHETAGRAPRPGRTDGHAGVGPISQGPAVVRDPVFEWRNARAADLLFTHRTDAILAAVVLIGLSIAVLAGRALTRTKAGRTQVALPAVLDWSGGSWTSIVRHGALLLFLVGLPFFVLAFADPYSTLTREDVSFPGRRIALMIDASSSMMARFPAAHLNSKAPNEATFFTTVAAADAFIRQRLSGKYHDLIGLIEFGDEAYVV